MGQQIIANDAIQKTLKIILFDLQIDTLVSGNKNVFLIIDGKNRIGFDPIRKTWTISDSSGRVSNPNFLVSMEELIQYLSNFPEPVLYQGCKTYEQYSYTLYEHMNGLIFWKKISNLLRDLTNDIYAGKNITFNLRDDNLNRTFEIGFNHRLKEFTIKKDKSEIPEKFFLTGLQHLLENSTANYVRRELNILYIKLQKNK